MDIIDLHDPAQPRVIYSWRIEDQDLHVGPGGMDVKHFKWQGRYYVVQSTQFGQGGPDADMGAVVLDVTGLPDPDSVTEVARLRAPEYPGGFHNIFIYKHTNDRVLLFTTVGGPYAYVYDLGHVIAGDMDDALVAKVPVGSTDGPFQGYHDLYVGHHPDSGEDRFYGGGTGGYFIYDVTDLENPALRISLTGISGVQWGHTFTPSPDGRYAIGETEYRYAPLRIFDLKPALDGETSNIRTPISAWTADWRHLVHNHEVRWPYVFVWGYVDGLQVFTLADPKNPQTVAYLRHLPRVVEYRFHRRLQRRLRRRRAQRRRVDCGFQLHQRLLGVPHGGLPGMERRRPRHAEHLECAELGRRSPEPPGSPESAAPLNLRILYVTTGIPIPGSHGGSVHTIELARGLVRRGHELHLVAQAGEPGTTAETADWLQGIRLYPVRPWLAMDQLQWTARKQVRRIAERVGPEIVIERFHAFGGTGLLAARALGVPAVAEVHTPARPYPGSWRDRLDALSLIRPIARWRRAQMEMASAFYGQAALVMPEEYREGYVDVVSGADTERFQPGPPTSNDGPLRCVYLSSFRAWHGAEDLVRAVARCVELGVDIQVSFLGHGPRWDAARAVARSAGVEDRVEFPGAGSSSRGAGALGGGRRGLGAIQSGRAPGATTGLVLVAVEAVRVSRRGSAHCHR